MCSRQPWGRGAGQDLKEHLFRTSQAPELQQSEADARRHRVPHLCAWGRLWSCSRLTHRGPGHRSGRLGVCTSGPGSSNTAVPRRKLCKQRDRGCLQAPPAPFPIRILAVVSTKRKAGSQLGVSHRNPNCSLEPRKHGCRALWQRPMIPTVNPGCTEQGAVSATQHGPFQAAAQNSSES